MVKVRVVDVYPYRLNESKIEYLLLRRSQDVPYAGQWRLLELSSRMVRGGVPPELVVRIEAGLTW